MKRLQNLWDAGVGALFVYGIYQVGRAEGKEEGLIEGYISGSVETVEILSSEKKASELED